VANDGLHLKIAQVNGTWQSAEVHLTEPLVYGTYTVQWSHGSTALTGT
jgi:methionine-rich copper-binding protein CopC